MNRAPAPAQAHGAPRIETPKRRPLHTSRFDSGQAPQPLAEFWPIADDCLVLRPSQRRPLRRDLLRLIEHFRRPPAIVRWCI
jgi:hypothetical protein